MSEPRLFPFSLLLLPAALCCGGCAKGSVDRTEEEEATDFCAQLETSPDEVPFSETPVGRHGSLHVEGPYLMSEYGHRVQLKGVSSMWLNWESVPYSSDLEGLRWMRDNWNVSVIRGAVGTSEADGSPVPGGYHEDPAAMRAKMDRIVENAIELGIYVLIDWHAHSAHMYQEAAAEFFDDYSSRYADYPNVIYETFNEPIMAPGDDWGTGEATWNEQLFPYHQAMVAVIRQNDPDSVIVLGTPRWSQILSAPVANPVPGENLMYTLHFYTCTHTDDIRAEAQRAIDAGLPIFVTEWGATDAGGGTEDKTICEDQGDAWHALLDANFISSAAWKLDGCFEGSCIFRPGAQSCGHWNDNADDGWLQGHGQYVVDLLKAGSVEEDGEMTFPPTDLETSSGDETVDGSPDAGQ